MAASAIIVVGAELNQQAVIATYDFPRVNWGKSRGHRVVGVPELATPKIFGTFLEEDSERRLNLRDEGCGSQGKNAGSLRISRVKPREAPQGLDKIGRK